MFEEFQRLLHITFFALRASSKGGGGDGVFRLLSCDQRASLVEIFQKLEEAILHSQRINPSSRANRSQQHQGREDRGKKERNQEKGHGKRETTEEEEEEEAGDQDVCMDYLHQLLEGREGEEGTPEKKEPRKRFSSMEAEADVSMDEEKKREGEPREKKKSRSPTASSGVYTPARSGHDPNQKENEISASFGKDLSSTTWQVIAWRNLRQIVWSKAASSSLCPHCRR